MAFITDVNVIVNIFAVNSCSHFIPNAYLDCDRGFRKSGTRTTEYWNVL